MITTKDFKLLDSQSKVLKITSLLLKYEYCKTNIIKTGLFTWVFIFNLITSFLRLLNKQEYKMLRLFKNCYNFKDFNLFN